MKPETVAGERSTNNKAVKSMRGVKFSKLLKLAIVWAFWLRGVETTEINKTVCIPEK